MGMEPAAAPVARLAGRLAGLAALCLGFDTGTVRITEAGEPVVRHSGRFPTASVAAAVERLDDEVLSRGLPSAIDDLSDCSAGQEPARSTAASGPTGLRGSFAGVPVRSGGRVVGTISVVDPTPRQVGRQQLRILVELARLLADQLLPTNGNASSGGAGTDDASAEIVAALSAGELRPWYQPVVDLATRSIVGVEALARWHRPSGAVEGPASFLPVAERSDLVLDVDRAILAQALADLAVWQQFRPEFRVSVNLSGRHLDTPDVLERVDGAVLAAGVSAKTVHLEITETARPTDLDTSREVLARFRERGYTVWFDDFGSGWSALQDLIRLPVGGIKLDRGFAEQLGTPVNDAVIAALASAADQVGLEVTIEGIQTAQQAERARSLGCHFGQGYLWSRPCPAADISAMIAD